jgi:hypothetical protein
VADPWCQPELRRALSQRGEVGAASLRAWAAEGRGPKARAAALLVADLLDAGWSVDLDPGGQPTFTRPEGAGPDRRARVELERARAAQLREPAVRGFISRMEAARLHAGGLRSVVDALADGRRLAAALEAAAGDVDALTRVIRPRVEVVEPEARCPTTGLLLSDLWRYLRHGWASPYRAAPGRGLAILIRDDGAPGAPVMGIGMLGSSPAQIRARDTWIGWEPSQVLARCRDAPTVELHRWLLSELQAELSDVYVADLLEAGTLTPGELWAPSPAGIRALRAAAHAHAATHRRYGADPLRDTPRAAEPGDGAAWRWERAARTPLMMAKRCALLASLLEARTHLPPLPASPEALQRSARTGPAAQAILTVARRAKARRMGSGIAEISVCGAVDPYRPLLAGKLVALLMAGAEVRGAWEQRYAGRLSQVASAVAGRPVHRGGTLGALVTTSLFGPGAQYNRVHGPAVASADRVGPGIRFQRVGGTLGFGTGHISPATRGALAAVVTERRGGAAPTSRMSEGVNPRMRLTREGLELLGLPANTILRHGDPREVYVVELGESGRAWLRGEVSDPRLFAPATLGTEGRRDTEELTHHWLRRWLQGRLRPEVLAKVAVHRTSRPPRHGARVQLPPIDD